MLHRLCRGTFYLQGEALRWRKVRIWRADQDLMRFDKVFHLDLSWTEVADVSALEWFAFYSRISHRVIEN